MKTGDFVNVRSRDEMLASLDENGRIDGMPLMPEMLAFAGQRLQVTARADKTCDTIAYSGMRRLEDTVHLGVRCDGSAHGGCQAACLIFWKEAWLRPVAPPEMRTIGTAGKLAPPVAGDQYMCQATELRTASRPMKWWDPTQYVRDVRSGNARLWDVPVTLARWFANTIARRFDERTLPRTTGHHRDRTPVDNLGLRPGELVRVKSRQQILATLDRRGRNRGLTFDVEMVRWCGGIFPVRSRVTRVIDERTRRMLNFPTPAVILEDVTCTSRYHRICPRAILQFWREAWLERV